MLPRSLIRFPRQYITSTKTNTLFVNHIPVLYNPRIVQTTQVVFFDDSNPQNNLSKEERQQLHKKANLGKLIEELKILVPNLLEKSLPKPLVSPDVLLRICPTNFDEFNAILPNIKGHVSYYTTLKSLQFVVTSLILNPNVKLHIQNIKVIEPQTSTVEYLCVFPHTTKVQIRWSTCNEGCHHLRKGQAADTSNGTENFHNNGKSFSTSYAKLGSHSWSEIDPKSFYQYHGDALAKSKTRSLSKALSQATKGFIGLAKNDDDLERVISGLFIFELNEDNTKIVVHTIEDVNIIEKQAPQEVGNLRIC